MNTISKTLANWWLACLHFIADRLWLRAITAEFGQPYLDRYRIWGWFPARAWNTQPMRRFEECPDGLQPFGTSLYLHRFRSRDYDDAPHNHPWEWAISFVLSGGYTERRLVKGELVERRVRPFRFNVIRHDTFHFVTELHGEETWTLILCGPKTSSWGFKLEGRGFIPWRNRLAERGIPV